MMPGHNKVPPAENRRRYHQGRVDAARTQLERITTYCGWLIAECKQVEPAVADEAIGRVAAIVLELNGRRSS